MTRAFCALSLLAACATLPNVPAERVAALLEVEPPAVAACRPLGKFTGVSTQPGEAGLKQAREEARVRAAAAGATHIVQGDELYSPDVITSALRAYQCGH